MKEYRVSYKKGDRHFGAYHEIIEARGITHAHTLGNDHARKLSKLSREAVTVYTIKETGFDS